MMGDVDTAYNKGSSLLKLVDILVGLRVDLEDESAGLDLTQHGERAYTD